MILGHSEPAPLPLDRESREAAFYLPGEFVTSEIMRLMFPMRCTLAPEICAALAERGDALLQRDMAVDGVARYGLHWRE